MKPCSQARQTPYRVWACPRSTPWRNWKTWMRQRETQLFMSILLLVCFFFVLWQAVNPSTQAREEDLLFHALRGRSTSLWHLHGRGTQLLICRDVSVPTREHGRTSMTNTVTQSTGHRSLPAEFDPCRCINHPRWDACQPESHTLCPRLWRYNGSLDNPSVPSTATHSPDLPL